MLGSPEVMRGDDMSRVPILTSLLVVACACACAGAAPPRDASASAGGARPADPVRSQVPEAARRTNAFLEEGRLADARASLEEELASARREGNANFELGSRFRGAWMEAELGDLAAAEAHVDALLGRLPTASLTAARHDHMRAAALTARVRILAGQGQFEAARQVADEVRRLSEARGNEGDLLVLETVLMWTETRAGRLDAALAHAAKAPPDFVLAPFYEAALRDRTGERDAAVRLRATVVEFADCDFFCVLVRRRAANGGEDLDRANSAR